MDIDLTKYALILLNLSGGKDSQTLAIKMVEEAKRQKVANRLLGVHSDTQAEWKATGSVVRNLCQCLDLPLEIVTPTVSIPDYVERRQRFPSMKCRFCTSQKTGAIDKLVRRLFPFKNESTILSVTGERREESHRRAKLLEYEPHNLTAGNRQVFHYRPLLDWREGKIWDTIKDSGIAPHPAYTEFGNKRLSCALCVFACDKDLRNGAKDRPDLAERYLRVERESGFLFREKRSLQDILYPKPDDTPDLFDWTKNDDCE